ncbi:MAG: DUF6279 family lipoprotein, partial [Desulfopila sp.]|nr:DUF6279 family lipoprotein [Desulfopila sp.]
MIYQLLFLKKGIKKVAGIIAAAIILSGCSSTKLAYRYADWGILLWIGEYIQLTDTQKTQLERDILSLQEWHCSTELPRYSEWLAELKQDVQSSNLPKDKVSYHQGQLFSFIPPLADQIQPAATHLLSSLSDEQIQALSDNIAENQAELEEEFLAESPEQTMQARAARAKKRIEHWLGSLNDDQTTTLEQWSYNRSRQTEIWLEGRRKWQQALLEVLERRKDTGFDGKIKYLIDNNNELRGSEYQDMLLESRSSLATLMTDILQEAEKQQLKHLLDRITALESDFNVLSCTEEKNPEQTADNTYSEIPLLSQSLILGF